MALLDRGAQVPSYQILWAREVEGTAESSVELAQRQIKGPQA